MARPTLYRLYDEDDRLLYVGMTINPPQRLMAHQCTKDWWDDVVRIEMERFPDRQRLKDAEYVWITFSQPVYNIQHAQDGDPKREPWALKMCQELLSDEIYFEMYGESKP